MKEYNRSMSYDILILDGFFCLYMSASLCAPIQDKELLTILVLRVCPRSPHLRYTAAFTCVRELNEINNDGLSSASSINFKLHLLPHT